MDRELLLLGLLRREEMHGYQLYEFIEHDLASCTDMKKSTAYYLLNKMAERGWITEETEQEGNRPPRRVYSLTPDGESAFQSLLRENLAETHPVYFSGDAGLAFLDALEPEESTALLEQRRHALERTLERLGETPAHGGSLHLVIEHQVHHLKSEIAWLDEVTARLQHTLPEE